MLTVLVYGRDGKQKGLYSQKHAELLSLQSPKSLLGSPRGLLMSMYVTYFSISVCLSPLTFMQVAEVLVFPKQQASATVSYRRPQ